MTIRVESRARRQADSERRLSESGGTVPNQASGTAARVAAASEAPDSVLNATEASGMSRRSMQPDARAALQAPRPAFQTHCGVGSPACGRGPSPAQWPGPQSPRRSSPGRDRWQKTFYRDFPESLSCR